MARTPTLSPAAQVVGKTGRWHDRLSEPSLTILVILELLGIFVAGPLTEVHLLPIPVDVVLVALVVLFTTLVVWNNRTAVITVLASFSLGLVSAALRHQLPSSLTIYLDFAAKLAFLAASTWVVGIAVFGPGQVTFHRIRGAVGIYLQIALIFGYFYLLIAQVYSQAFAPPVILSGPTGDVLRGASGGSSLIYFSFTTLTSTGYGDIVPVHPFARSLATLEALVGQLFPATILARLVTLELESRRH